MNLTDKNESQCGSTVFAETTGDMHCSSRVSSFLRCSQAIVSKLVIAKLQCNSMHISFPYCL